MKISNVVFYSILLATMQSAAGITLNNDATVMSAWQASSNINEYSQLGTGTEFFLAGGVARLPNNSNLGMNGDEFGGVALLSSSLVEHGGYFCTYQVQCHNKHCKAYSNSLYYQPTGFNAAKHCEWLCADGYSGTNCTTPPSGIPLTCDSANYKTKFKGVSMIKSGGRDVEQQVQGWNTESSHYSGRERDMLVGVIKYLDHGVIAAPIAIQCYAENRHYNDSWIESVMIKPSYRVLCAPGYRANSSNTDCEIISQDLCTMQSIGMCAGFDRTAYDETIHRLDTKDGCAKYFCAESGYAFPSSSDVSCAECATGVMGGAHPKTGVCVKCTTGQFFNEKTGSCETAAAYSKSDLQYGKGKTKNNVPDIKNQCWTQVNTDDYKDCVRGKLKSN